MLFIGKGRTSCLCGKFEECCACKGCTRSGCLLLENAARHAGRTRRVLLRCAGERRAALRWRLFHLREREDETLGANKKRAALRRRKLLCVIRDNFKIA